jgi:hypothetical protein
MRLIGDDKKQEGCIRAVLLQGHGLNLVCKRGSLGSDQHSVERNHGLDAALTRDER